MEERISNRSVKVFESVKSWTTAAPDTRPEVDIPAILSISILLEIYFLDTSRPYERIRSAGAIENIRNSSTVGPE